MTNILKEDDKIFTMYKQYIDLIRDDVEKNNEFVYGIDQLAARLTVAHMLDHVVGLIKNETPPTANKIKTAPKTLLEVFSEPQAKE